LWRAWFDAVSVEPAVGLFRKIQLEVVTMFREKNCTPFGVVVRRGGRGIAQAAKCAVETLESRVLLSVNVTNYHYNLAETGANTNETILTPANVNTSSFGKVASLPVDGQIYAQPLVMTGVAMPGGGSEDLVFVATEHDSVYAFNAAGASTTPVWKVSLLQSGETTIPYTDTGTNDITPEIGITSTPVINPATNTLYVEANFKESNGAHQQRLYALNIATGASVVSPVIMSGAVPGTGPGSSGGTLSFNALLENQRPALTLANGQVYVTFASHGDNGNYHGWVVAYNQTTLAQDYIWCDTPNGTRGGIWMSGGGLAVDSNGDLYLTSGNGTFDANTGGSDYGMALVKLSPSLQVLDYFSPYNQASLSNNDEDYGCGNAILLPTQSGSAPNEALTLGKWGGIYLHNTDTGKMGEFTANGPNNDLGEANTNLTQHNTFAYWNGQVYVGPDGGTLRDYAVANGALAATPTSQSSHVFGGDWIDGQGAGISISSNGNSNGIAWALENTGYNHSPAVLYAYNAANLNQVYWASNQDGTRDTAGNAVKFTTPVVANGFVYVGGAGTLTLYGNLPSAPPPPAAATFVKADSTTSGNWTGTYGTQGYSIDGGSTSWPNYVAAYGSNDQFFEWAAPGQAGSQAPQASPGSSSHVAACSYSYSSFSAHFSFTDGQSHQVSLYLLDYDNQGRVETVQVANGQSGQILDARTVNNFAQGQYLVYDLSGDVTINFVNSGPQNAVLSAILFDSTSTAGATATFSGVDATTRGNWTGAYGAQGYDVIDGSSNLPGSTVSYSFNGAQTYQWAASTNDPRDLQTSPGSSNLVAACAYSGNSNFSMNLDLLDGQTHRVGFYLLDYDARNRAETIQIANAVTGAVLDTQTFNNFTGGQYVRWNLSGNLKITFTNAGGLNEVVSGFFIDPASSTSAAFVKTDSTTQGNWTGVYGKDGYDVINSAQSLPGYAMLSIPGSVSNYTWNPNPTQTNALQDNPGNSARIAACDYSDNSSFSFNLNLTDGKTHQVALYVLDWDWQNRAETIQIHDASTGNLLDTQYVSSFTSGKYLVWNLSGNLNITLTNAGGLNEVMSGIFFG
jgi:hypothetical protein